jgi:hypothetical protein
MTQCGDPGEFRGYAPIQETTAMLLDAFRKINPRAKARIWSWEDRYGQFDPAKLDPRAKSLLDDTFMAADVEYALPMRESTQEEKLRHVKVVKDAGRKVGWFPWYTTDYENSWGDHQALYGVRSVYQAAKNMAKGSEYQLDFMTVERCWHAVPADIVLYLSGQAMWDCDRPMEESSMEFLQALYGAEHAEKMAKVYQTVRECQGSLHDDQWVEKSVANSYGRKALEALQLLYTVRIPAWHVPALQTPNTPQGYMLDLERELKDVIASAQLVEVQRAAGDSSTAPKDEGVR